MRGASRTALPWLLALVLALLGQGLAHPMPSSTVLLDVQAASVQAELNLPLSELGLALHEDLSGDAAALLTAHGAEWRAHLPQHVRALSLSGQPWTVTVGDLSVGQAEQTATGPYRELTAHLILTPPAGADVRTLTLQYDVIMHQVVTHTALVSVRQDWASGVIGEQPAELGVIRVNPVDGTVPALQIDRSGGSLWTGFLATLRLGASHIAEGTDHLLFLLTLLLPAPLIAAGRRWGAYAGARRSATTILKIVTAFTVGHSLTLIIGTVTRAPWPAPPVEALIALSILVSAVHALRPVFPGREMWIAGGFGLIHGMAFSATLAHLHLSAPQMALSLLGFNLGIEAMQLAVIVGTLPWLILLARTPAYSTVRVLGAGMAILASLGWLGQRLGLTNPLGTLADGLGVAGPWIVLLLALAALVVTTLHRRSQVRAGAGLLSMGRDRS